MVKFPPPLRILRRPSSQAATRAGPLLPELWKGEPWGFPWGNKMVASCCNKYPTTSTAKTNIKNLKMGDFQGFPFSGVLNVLAKFLEKMSDFSLEFLLGDGGLGVSPFPMVFWAPFQDTIRQSFGGVPPVWGLARRSARWHNWKEPVEDSIEAWLLTDFLSENPSVLCKL